jgi:hypothetical protein
MDDRAAREAYVDRLYARVNDLVGQEAPHGFGRVSWDDLAPVETHTKEEMARYVEGGEDRRVADDAAHALLLAWRSLIKRFRRGDLHAEG